MEPTQQTIYTGLFHYKGFEVVPKERSGRFSWLAIQGEALAMESADWFESKDQAIDHAKQKINQCRSDTAVASAVEA